MAHPNPQHRNTQQRPTMQQSQQPRPQYMQQQQQPHHAPPQPVQRTNAGVSTPPINFAILQQQVNYMLKRVCNILVQPSGTVEDNQVALRRDMNAHMSQYQDVLYRMEDQLNVSRTVLRRDYAKFQAEQKRKQDEVEKSRAPQPAQEVVEAPAQPDVVVEDDIKEPSPNASTIEPSLQPLSTTADPITSLPEAEQIDLSPTLDLDSMLKDLTSQPQTTNESFTSDAMAIDLPNPFDAASPNLSSLLPGLDSYANIPSTTTDEKTDAKKEDVNMADETDLLTGDLGDSNFDDLFNFGEGGMEFGDDGGDGQLAIDDLMDFTAPTDEESLG